MRTKLTTLASLFAVLIMSVVAAAAAPLVDTGPGDLSPTLYTNNDPVLGNQWLAGQFTLSKTSYVGGISGFMSGDGFGGTGSIALYRDQGTGVPTLGTAIFGASFAVPADYVTDWYGVTGLGLRLDAGTYWVAFEALVTDELYASLPSGVPNPLAAYAFLNGASYQPLLDPPDFGVRIDPVPEPATMALLATGLAGSALMRSRKRAKKQG